MTATVTPAAESSSMAAALTAADRCDRCGAQARVRVVLASGELLFCGHHAHEYEPTLKGGALQWLEDPSDQPA